MKIIKYKFLSCEINRGTEEFPHIEQVLLQKCMPYSTETEEVAKVEAYNGEYTIEDVGEEAEVAATTEERISALEEAMLEVLGVVMNND